MGYYLTLKELGSRKLPFFLNAAILKKIMCVEVAEARAHRTTEPRDVFLVAVLDVGPYDAAAVAVDARDVDTFCNNRDDRPIRYFICPRDWLKEVEPTFYL